MFGQHILNNRYLGTLCNASPSKVDLGMSFQYVISHLNLAYKLIRVKVLKH